LGLQEGFRVVGIEAVPGIAVVVHDDLGCHRYAPDVGRQIKAKLPMLDVGESSAPLVQLPARVVKSGGEFQPRGKR
ncbi:MAG: hypothetical protein ACXU84_10335, partial [Xanthobacteraceae bacterium]